MRWRAFSGTPRSAVKMQPFVGPGDLCDTGVWLGIDMFTRKPVLFDPWRLKLQGKIHSTVFLVLGEKGSGKTTLMQSVAARLMARQAGINGNGEPISMRTRIHDRKREGGDPEYKSLTEHMMSEVVSLNRAASINIFDPSMKMGEWDILETAVNVCEFANNDVPLQDFQPLALQVAVHRMLREFPELMSPEVLRLLLWNLNKKDVDDYYQRQNRQVADMFREMIADAPADSRLDLERQLEFMDVSSTNVPESKFRDDAALVASYLNRLLAGDFGRIIGGNNSLRSLLSTNMGTWDWTGVNDKARTVVESMLWKWQEVALNNNDLELIPHINIGDEEHEAFYNLMYLRFRSAAIKKARQIHTADFRATQYLPDLTNAGDEGSEKRTLASGIVRGTGLLFIGKQPNDPEVLRSLARYFRSKQDLSYLTQLPVGCFAVASQDRPPIFYRHVLTDTEYGLFQSDAAAKSMVVTSKRTGEIFAGDRGFVSVGEN
jgi:energy-coupling factor transporter ATP-binding protein EcfA2